MAILPNLNNATDQALKARIAELEAKLAEASKPKTITMKVTAPKADGTGTSGAISIYGLGRFPITLYRSQLERLISAVPQIEAFIKANHHLLATKD